ncbi:TELO2-interacting protein 1 homolog [Sabethes cyaneus]|uniref:TELO2-interacting protein 1 homolog n=1 Tax=Sabethes cyaneus TaxID=53552 RepID=UPI00237ECEF4|nr:TELO2-interacting protein 1 homolog [Sabethes cyaneus]
MNTITEIFTRVKPLFEKVLRSQDVADIRRLNELLVTIDGPSMQILQRIWLQQLVILVDNVSGRNVNEIKTALLECLCTILQKCKFSQAVAMKTTLVVLLKQIYNGSEGKLVDGLSEEMKLATVKALTLTSKNIESELVEEVYRKDNLNLLSQVLFVCVTLLGTERYRKLRIHSVECILATMQIHDEFDSTDSVLRHQVAELLFIVLPKLLVALVTVINGDEKQGTAVVRIAVKALGRILVLIFEDYEKKHLEQLGTTEDFVKLSKELGTSADVRQNVLGMGLRNSKAREEYFSSAERNQAWLLEADKRVHKVLTTIAHLRGVEEDSVRLEYARMNADLLDKCLPNMPCCSVTFLESLLALRQDSAERVRTVCGTALEASSNKGSLLFGSFRTDELFYEALKPIARSIYRAEETDQIAHFQLIKGYFNFLTDSQLNVVLSNQEILNQLIVVLLAGAELDQSDELVRREYLSYRFEYASDGDKLGNEKRESRWIILRNFQGSNRAEKTYLEMVHSLSEHPNSLGTILNYIQEDLFTTKLNNNSYLFLLSELIPTEVENTLLSSGLRNVFSEILQSYHWQLELDDTAHVSDLKFNVLHICLALRLVGRFCHLFRKDFACWQLYDVLRNILSVTGSSLNCLVDAAEMTLDSIAGSFGFDSIHGLITDNLDYISQHIGQCLKRPSTFPAVVHTLESVLRFVPYESSVVLESTISPIVMTILDNHDQRVGTGRILCLRVLQIFIRAIRLRYVPSPLEEDDLRHQTDAQNKLDEKLAQLKKQVENKLPAQEFGATLEELSDEDDEKNDLMEAETEPEVPYQSEEDKLPAHIRMTLKILTVCFKYLSSTVPDERIIALGTLDEGIRLLRDHENQLLPLVHQIWFNFSERFADSNVVVIGRAFDLLVTLAQLAKDFIRKRTLDDVLPRLTVFMRDSVSADCSAHQTFKLQRKILTHAPELVIWLQLNERQLDRVLEVVKLYIDRRHPNQRRELQSLARSCFERLAARYDPGAVFVKLGCDASFFSQNKVSL